MPATPRDLLKPEAERLYEVNGSIQEQAGQANGQQILWGLQLERVNSNVAFKVKEGEGSYDGVSLPLLTKITAETAVPAAATLTSGQFCLVLIELVKPTTNEATPEVKTSVSTITGVAYTAPVERFLPELTVGRLAVAFLLLEGSFTPGTTAIPAEPTKETEKGIHKVLYSAGRKAPESGF